MQIFQVIGAIVAVMAIILLPMFVLYRTIRFIWLRFVEPPVITQVLSSINPTGIPQKINPSAVGEILSRKFRYYQKLDDQQKSRFLKRVLDFMPARKFRGMEGLALTEEMVVLISASAVQLTFGLDAFVLDHYSLILVYPREFFSRRNKAYHKGETNLGGAIVLSWKHFDEGYKDATDNYNLGLHEMAHALRFDSRSSEDYDRFFAAYLEKWQLISGEEFEKIRSKQPSFFREYAGTNFSEFFSVCIETFFESPAEFKEALPEIYSHLCILLNQDPLSNNFNYREQHTDRKVVFSTTPLFTFSDRSMALKGKLSVQIPILVVAGYYGWKAGIGSAAIIVLLLAIVGVYFARAAVLKRLRIDAYDMHLELRSVITPTKNTTLPFGNIVSVLFISEQFGTSAIKFFIVENGRLSTMRYFISMSDSDEQQFKKLLADKKIPAKFA